jgi:hypothetical protein
MIHSDVELLARELGIAIDDSGFRASFWNEDGNRHQVNKEKASIQPGFIR